MKSWGLIFDLYNKKFITLTKLSYTFGRERDCNVVINNANCSKKQFQISIIRNFHEEGEAPVVKITDLGSMNGTFLNGKLLGANQSRVLAPDDDIHVKPGHVFVYSNSNDPNTFMNLIKKGDNYSFMLFENSLLGSGTSAEVKRAFCFERKELVACKVVNLKKSSKKLLKRCIDQEMSILPKLRHPGIVQVFDIVVGPTQVLFFLELVAGGELLFKIDQTGSLSEKESKFVVYQLALALEYMHSQKVCHRDLKPDNILVNTQKGYCRVSISDFGMSKMIQARGQVMKTICGTPEYSAPELLLSHALNKMPGYDTKIDSWSLGVTLYLMLSGHLPFEERKTYDDLLRELKEGLSKYGLPGLANKKLEWRGSRWSVVSSEAKDLVEHLLCFDPLKRYSMTQVLSHPWIQNDISLLKQIYAKLLSKTNAKKRAATDNDYGTSSKRL